MTKWQIETLLEAAQHEVVDMGPFGGVETFVSHDDMVISRTTIIALCRLALKSLPGTGQ